MTEEPPRAHHCLQEVGTLARVGGDRKGCARLAPVQVSGWLLGMGWRLLRALFGSVDMWQEVGACPDTAQAGRGPFVS